MQPDELKAIRESLGWKQKRFAEALGLTAASIGQMERAVRPIERRTVLAAKYLTEHPEEWPDPDWDDPKSSSSSERLRTALEQRRLKDGMEWGPWRFSAETLTLDYRSRIELVDRDGEGRDILKRSEDYYVALEEMTTAKAVLGWIGHLAEKSWGTAALGYFIEALDFLFPMQSTFVYGKGFDNSDAVIAYLRRRVTKHDPD